jgi:hypothetical protein
MRKIPVSCYAAAVLLALVGCTSDRGSASTVAKGSASPTVASLPSASTPSGVHRPHVCRAKDLVATHRPGEGAESQDYSVILLRTVGGMSCTLDGWPTVRLLDDAHQPIGSVAGRRVSKTPKLVRLGPQQPAGVTISVASVEVPTAADCGQEATALIAVRLPGGARLTLPAVIHVCSRDLGLTTGPVRSGARLSPF